MAERNQFPIGAGVCQSCGTPILWRRHVTTRKVSPINASPAELGKGNIQLLPNDEEYVIVPADERGDRLLHVSHFATCPRATEYRGLR